MPRPVFIVHPWLPFSRLDPRMWVIISLKLHPQCSCGGSSSDNQRTAVYFHDTMMCGLEGDSQGGCNTMCLLFLFLVEEIACLGGNVKIALPKCDIKIQRESAPVVRHTLQKGKRLCLLMAIPAPNMATVVQCPALYYLSFKVFSFKIGDHLAHQFYAGSQFSPIKHIPEISPCKLLFFRSTSTFPPSTHNGGSFIEAN